MIEILSICPREFKLYFQLLLLKHSGMSRKTSAQAVSAAFQNLEPLKKGF